MAVGADKTKMNLDKNMNSIMVNKIQIMFFFLSSFFLKKIKAATVFDGKYFITVQKSRNIKDCLLNFLFVFVL